MERLIPYEIDFKNYSKEQMINITIQNIIIGNVCTKDNKHFAL